MAKRGRPKKQKSEESQILTTKMFRDDVSKDVKQPDYDSEEFNELYPDIIKKEEQDENVTTIIEETKRDIPISNDAKVDIYNRLVGIQNIANEVKEGKYKKIIMLAQEIITLLELDNGEKND